MVAEAAAATLELEPGVLALEVDSPQGDYMAEGLIEPGAGHFRLQARGEPSLGPARSVTAIGLTEDGDPVTLREELVPFQGEQQRCWYGTHAPVGANRATASLQEAVHLMLAALETMRAGRMHAESAEGGQESSDTYLLTLRRPLPGPSGRGSFYGEASLRENLADQIRVAISDGIVTGLTFRLRDYRPAFGWEATTLEPRPVTIEATIAAADEPLDLPPPPCTGTE